VADARKEGGLIMSAHVRKAGSEDYGHYHVECNDPECRDRAGFFWQQSYSRRAVEGLRLAERARDEHNKARHSANWG
jgi:hypothetical protein